jgi:hypothetical protein
MDPISAFGILSGAIQITQIITNTVQGLASLRGRFKDADLTIRLLITELSTIKSAIAQLHDWAEYNSEGSPKNKEYLRGLDVALDGVQAIMDILSEEVTTMAKGIATDGAAAVPLGLRARIRVVWNEDVMRDHRQRLHSQVLALQLLLQACQWCVQSPPFLFCRWSYVYPELAKIIFQSVFYRADRAASNEGESKINSKGG